MIELSRLLREPADAEPPPAGPALRTRLLLAAAAAAWGGAIAWVMLGQPHAYRDFLYPWTAARVLLAGGSPYRAIPGGASYPYGAPFVYPLPAVLAIVPLAMLPYAAAGTLFVALSCALLAFAITRDGYQYLPIFASAPFLGAASQAQWSPLIVAAALLPGLGALAVCKPNLGLALAARRPTRALVVGGAVVVAATVLWRPAWPGEWLANVARLRIHPAPLTTPLGFILLLALARWRRPEARLLVAMACVPQLLFWSDQLPLLLVPRTLRQSLWCCALSSASVGLGAWVAVRTGGHPIGAGLAPDALARHAALPVMLGMYLPALVLVLRRPNEGQVPRWADRLARPVERRAAALLVRLRPSSARIPPERSGERSG